MVEFDNSVSYPYQYTLVVASHPKGPGGEGKYELTVFAQDSTFKLGNL